MNWTRRELLASVASAACLRRSVFGAPQEQPNFVTILADDLGYGDLGAYGSPYIETPHIDRMAREGVRFTDFYAQPLCGPSRSALLTGCYPVRNSLMFNHLPRARTGIHPQEVTLAEQMQARGYRTMIVGKWHLGDAPEFLPTRHGFDAYFGLPYSNDMWPFHPKIVRTPNEDPRLTAIRARAEMTGYDGRGQTYPVDWFPPLPLMEDERVVELNPDQSTLTRRYTEKALAFITAHRRRPFFLYLAHSMPHVPLFVGKAFEGRSKRGLYGDVISELDAGVGLVLETLRHLGIDRRTLVVFLSDNGPWLPYGIDAGAAGPFRGAKGSAWEGGIRVPAIFWGPGRLPEGRICSEFAATIDLFATFSRLAGAPLPNDRVIDGKDIWPLLVDASAHSPHEAFYIYQGAVAYRPETGRPTNTRVLQAVRSGRWKLHVAAEGGRYVPSALYDLYSDIGETSDVAARHPEIVERLLRMGLAFDQDIQENARPFGEKSG